MKKVLKLLAVVLFIITGCAPQFDVGEVCDKKFEPSYYWFNAATESVEWEPDHWYVTIKHKNEKTNEWETCRKSVSKEKFDRVSVGDYFNSRE